MCALDRMTYNRELLCYIYGAESQWTALCVDLDIMVEAVTLHDAKQQLNAMVQSYIDDAHSEDPATCARLLSRSSPLWVRFSLWLTYQIYLIRRSKPHSKSYSTLSVPCPA